MSPARPARIAHYERRIAGALGAVWENVHDWEHLPWLHHESFRAISLLDSGDWGWRARVGLPPDPGGAEIEIELRRIAGEEAYDVTTLAGPGTGTVIATRLSPAGSDATDVEVGFHVPGVGGDAADGIGRVYVALYQRLWDQDESMITQREAALARPPGPIARTERIDLGPRAALSLPAGFALAGRLFQLVEIEGALVAFAARCPHRQGPLPAAADAEHCVRCPWHGYRFDLRTGRSADGRGLRLARAPEVRVLPDGRVEAVLEPGP